MASKLPIQKWMRLWRVSCPFKNEWEKSLFNWNRTGESEIGVTNWNTSVTQWKLSEIPQ